ncbi:hypothetical protein K437DRAFT_153177 [Tilletiaria anomala UBC 951]|uniref:Uncharacterized protein n=1 Tax=Tilletiaria anomala (strain ATCC 24038 / CBS 436.72 / UBC 951) TaxID=1037660 RepID=A0A066VSR5_TILAU|nr:uncharacterized protein K437DRAFT_153177 [Tilletiaria anomala UBC 951]KDN43318.1 hypothetical protein K437DRAFT_153177 [Tilletiaria anomala UBC 951]
MDRWSDGDRLGHLMLAMSMRYAMALHLIADGRALGRVVSDWWMVLIPPAGTAPAKIEQENGAQDKNVTSPLKRNTIPRHGQQWGTRRGLCAYRGRTNRRSGLGCLALVVSRLICRSGLGWSVRARRSRKLCCSTHCYTLRLSAWPESPRCTASR